MTRGNSESRGGRRGVRGVKLVVAVVALVVVLLVAGFAWYASDYCHASETALSIVADDSQTPENVTVMRLESGDIAFVPDRVTCGLSFYPGGKVEAESYARLLTRCAEKGILCVLATFPANIAFFGPNAATRAREEFPDIEDWVICGHSLGGIVASSYVAKHPDDVRGIVLLASYPTADLTAYQGEVLSIVGSNDGVLRRDAYEEARARLPQGARELIIQGGNHACFGDYGEQEGDGRATITREEQQDETASAIADLVRSCIDDQ